MSCDSRAQWYRRWRNGLSSVCETTDAHQPCQHRSGRRWCPARAGRIDPDGARTPESSAGRPANKNSFGARRSCGTFAAFARSVDPHRDTRLGLDLVDRDETFADLVDREATFTNLADREATFAALVDRLSVLAARLSTEEFRRLIRAMAQARQQRDATSSLHE